MSIPAEHSGIRIAADNPNHHLWNNHGTWFLHYTVHPTPFTKERIRRSLGTKDLETARSRRDTFFAHLRASKRRPEQILGRDGERLGRPVERRP